MGLDRPSPDHSNAKVILLIRRNLESGHTSIHTRTHHRRQRGGAKLIVFDTRCLQPLPTQLWVAPYPGSERHAGSRLRNYLIQNDSTTASLSRRGGNWKNSEFRVSRLEFDLRTSTQTEELYKTYTFEFAGEGIRCRAKVMKRSRNLFRLQATQFSSHKLAAALHQA